MGDPAHIKKTSFKKNLSVLRGSAVQVQRDVPPCLSLFPHQNDILKSLKENSAGADIRKKGPR
jgi:hypothetical protein